MEKARNRIDVKLVSNKKDYLKWESKPRWNFCMSEDEKKKKTDFYGVMVSIYTIWKYYDILTYKNLI